jgi:hypothetical protein
MADKSTFIKIDRNIINWRWFQSPKILSVFIWLLIKANIKEGYFKKEKIERGSLATSNAHIAEGCGLTIDNVRTALANLEQTGEISRESRNHYQIIHIINYESYQSDTTKSRYQIPSNPDSKSRANPEQIPTIKEYKNKRMERKNNKGRSAPDSPLGIPERGTDAFRAKSHLLLNRDEGTFDDIPTVYRDMFDNFATYHDWRNQ